MGLSFHIKLEITARQTLSELVVIFKNRIIFLGEELK